MPSLILRLLTALLAPRRRAHAHTGTHSYVMLTIDGRRVTGSVQFPIHDLEHVLEIDLTAQDAGLLAAVAGHLGTINGYAHEHLTISSDEGEWDLEFTGLRVLPRADRPYAALDYRVFDPPRPLPASVSIGYDGILHDRDHHEALVIVHTFSGVGRMRTRAEQEFIFTRANTSARIHFPKSGASAEVAGTARFVVAESAEVARRIRKRVLRF